MVPWPWQAWETIGETALPMCMETGQLQGQIPPPVHRAQKRGCGSWRQGYGQHFLKRLASIMDKG